MTPQLVEAGHVDAQAWRNGGGRTRELLRWPQAPAADWALRISVADIDADGPFSSFPGVERWFAVIEGAGVVLRLGDALRPVRPGDPALRFDGTAAPGCTLIDGPTRDLNLMLRGGHGLMQPVVAGVEWTAAFEVRALFTAVAGEWRAGDGRLAVPAFALLWTDAPAAAAWAFEPAESSTTAMAWWLGFTPSRGLQ